METEKLEHGTLENWTPEEVLQGLKNKEIILVDVRTPQEFNFERIRGALLSPMQEFDPSYIPASSDRKLVLHCGSGVRSKKMSELCHKAGISTIAHMAGGIGEWKKRGLPYIAIDTATGAPRETSQGK